MGKMKINSDDAEWLREYYPGLRIKNGDTITGILRFRAKMKPKSKPPLIKPPEIEIWDVVPNSVQGKLYIEDCYEIEGFFGENLYPHFKETGGRLNARAQTTGKDVIDLHVFPDGEKFCLGHPARISLIMRQDNSIRSFFKKLLIPYLYYHSYWEKHGIEPWRGLKHGDVGILEELDNLRYKTGRLDFVRITLEHLSNEVCQKICQCLISGSEPGRNDVCFCGSGKKIKGCCKDRAMTGFNLLCKTIKKEGLFYPLQLESCFNHEVGDVVQTGHPGARPPRIRPRPT